MNPSVKYLVITQSGIGGEAGTLCPILDEKKQYWTIIICNLEKKVFKCSGAFAGAPKSGPLFAVYDQHTPPDLKPKPKRLTPAEKQARYRDKLAKEKIRIFFSREDIKTIKMILSNPRHDLEVDPHSIDRINKAFFDAVLTQ
ncbi:MAG: hypothetical protein ACRC9N_11190 [Aeromonas sp.]